jgi:class 3 adenylate cyclase/tetratricopeptide (TPR) repeat protein
VDLERRGVPSWERVDGSMLSADISGFTALSERLAGKGRAGAEELNQLMSACFTALIDAAYRFGGEVIKFGGDALLVLYRGTDHARRSTDAGLAMQEALNTSAAAKRAQLTMTVGIADGPFDAFLVGSSARHLLMTGPRSTEVIRLESAASHGETLVSPFIARHLPHHMCLGSPGGTADGAVAVTGSTGDPPVAPTVRALGDVDLVPHVARAVNEQLAAFSKLGGEHRSVVIGFVFVGGVDGFLERSGHEATARALTTVVDGVVAACERFGVTVLDSDIAADGVKFILAAGAPVNLGDTADAMLQAALEIAAIDAPFAIRQGVQRGRVFAGFLGHPHRKAYTVMGDPVNTAARMLGKAGDREVVAVSGVLEHTRAVYTTDHLAPFMVKGKSEPVDAQVVRSVTDRVRRDGGAVRLLGRDRELAVITDAIERRSGVVHIVGAAGVGKSRLVEAAIAAAADLQIHHAACTPYGAASPYSVFRPLLRDGTGAAIDATPYEMGLHLESLVDDVAPHIRPLLPLLAVPFGAFVPSTEQAEAIDPEFRGIRIRELVVEFLDAALPGSALLVIEDAHWIDAASSELLEHLIRAAADRPWVAIVTRRPEGTWDLSTDPAVTTIALGQLDDASIRRLAVAASELPLLDRDLDAIAERAHGNPLFAMELARAIADGTGELPDSIEQILSGRVDRLPPRARRLVRIASVLGNRFDRSTVAAMAAEAADRPEIDAALDAAARAAVVIERAPGTWEFQHSLYRDTAYGGLPFSRRRALHHRAAIAIEQRAANTDEMAALLSLHYSEARSYLQAWRYSVIAAKQAEAQQATIEAAAAYERALTAGRRSPRVPDEERARIAERLGDLLYELGRFDDSERAFREARRRIADGLDDVRLVRKLGAVFERMGDPERAIAWYRRAARAIPDGGEPGWALARAEVALAEAGIRSRQGDQHRCLALARQAHMDAVSAGDRRVAALALERMHLATIYPGPPDDDGEELGRAALEAHQALDDRSGMARVLINLGIEAYFSSRWDDAGARYLEALDLAQRSGSVVLAATAAINSAEVLSDQGDWARAIELLESAHRNYAAVGYSAGVAATELFSGVAAMRDGRLEEARRQLDTARVLLVELGMADMVDEVDSRLVELDLLAGRPVAAVASELLARLGATHRCAARVLRAGALDAFLAGDTSDAERTLRVALAAGPDHGLERSLTLRALVAVVPSSDDAGAWLDEAGAIDRSLGVRQSPPLLPASSMRR